MMKKIFIAGIMLLSTLLHADYIVEFDMDNSVQIFKYHSPTSSKIITQDDGDKNEIYRVGKKTYIVSGRDGDKTIVDVDKMRAMSKAMGFNPSQNIEEKPKYKIKKTGKRVKVAGINGEEWIVSGVEDGEKYETKVVVTKDKRVVKGIRAMFKLFATMSGIEDDSFFELKKGFVTIKADGIQLKSFSEEKVPSSEYKLPTDAKGQKLPDMKKSKKELESIEKKSSSDPKPVRNIENDKDLDEAVNMLKSFF